MSSLIRRLQKGIAKGQGFYRSTDEKRKKVIRDSKDKIIGARWPQVAHPTKKGGPQDVIN